jgi:hypothetical protein
MPDARRAPAVRVQKVVSTRQSPQVQPPTGIPRAMVLTVSFVLFLVTGLCCHHRRCDAKHRHQCNAARIVTNLTPASGRQNHTTSPSASVRLVLRAEASIASRTQRS